jgi:very-short-patch-repair endonuclease
MKRSIHFDKQRPIGNFILDFYCKDLQLAIEIDGITHLEEKIKLNDEHRQKELEILGVFFLRFDALLVVNRVEAVTEEIKRWIGHFERKNGISEFVIKRRMKSKNPPLPLQGGDPQAGGQGQIVKDVYK